MCVKEDVYEHLYDMRICLFVYNCFVYVDVKLYVYICVFSSVFLLFINKIGTYISLEEKEICL